MAPILVYLALGWSAAGAAPVESTPSFGLGTEVIFRDLGREPGFGPSLAFSLPWAKPWSSTDLQLRPRTNLGALRNIVTTEIGLEVTHPSLAWRKVSLAGFVSVLPEVWTFPEGAREFRIHGNGGIMAVFEISRVQLTLSLGVDQSAAGVRVWF